jgi:hypothetical protein
MSVTDTSKTERVAAHLIERSDLIVLQVASNDGLEVTGYGEIKSINADRTGYLVLRTVGGTTLRLPRFFPVERVKV